MGSFGRELRRTDPVFASPLFWNQHYIDFLA